MACQPADYNCIIKNCSGGIGAGEILFNYWNTNDCPSAYSQSLNTLGDIVAYNNINLPVLQQDVINLFNTYFLTNSLTDNVTSTQFNTFQETLLDLCIDPTLPGICQAFLTNYCKQYTRDEVLSSVTLTNFCGCYTPPNPIIYESTGLTACDPLCHRARTSQQSLPQTGELLSCPQQVCVIDSVTVNLDNTRFDNTINFNSVCAGCGGDDGGPGCLCYISGSNISETMGSVGVTTNFNQFCGPGSVCIVNDVVVPCPEITSANIPAPTFAIRPSWGIIAILILVILFVIFIAITIRVSESESESENKLLIE